MPRIGNMLNAERRNLNAALKCNVELFLAAKRSGNAKCQKCGNSEKFGIKEDILVCGVCKTEILLKEIPNSEKNVMIAASNI